MWRCLHSPTKFHCRVIQVESQMSKTSRLCGLRRVPLRMKCTHTCPIPPVLFYLMSTNTSIDKHMSELQSNAAKKKMYTSDYFCSTPWRLVLSESWLTNRPIVWSVLLCILFIRVYHNNCILNQTFIEESSSIEFETLRGLEAPMVYTHPWPPGMLPIQDLRRSFGAFPWWSL